MEEGILEAGEDVLTVEYKSQLTKGTLTEDGRIQCRINGQDQTFESPSAFSIFLKRLINPSRKVCLLMLGPIEISGTAVLSSIYELLLDLPFDCLSPLNSVRPLNI